MAGIPHRISTIIPTYNGKHKILKTLQSLENQQYKAFETIVIIDGSTDGTYEYLMGQELALNLRIHQQENMGRASVRNTGAEIAKGELLIFYDDDISPKPDSIKRHVDFHVQYDNAICGGNQLENIADAKNDFDLFRCYIRNKWISKYPYIINEITKDNIYLTAANMSIPKKLFLHLNGFDEDLRDAEDYVLAHKALDNKVALYFDKLNIGWHNDFCTLGQYIYRRRLYTQNFLKLSESYPGIFEKKIKISRPGVLKKYIYQLFARRKFVELIEFEKINFIPSKIRYKIYEFVVTSLGSVHTTRTLQTK